MVSSAWQKAPRPSARPLGAITYNLSTNTIVSENREAETAIVQGSLLQFKALNTFLAAGRQAAVRERGFRMEQLPPVLHKAGPEQAGVSSSWEGVVLLNDSLT